MPESLVRRKTFLVVLVTNLEKFAGRFGRIHPEVFVGISRQLMAWAAIPWASMLLLALLLVTYIPGIALFPIE